MKKNILLAYIFCANYINAQFHGAVGTVGTSAMFKDSSAFIGWASNCVVTRGYQDIAITSGGYATVGLDSNGTNKAGVNPVVSLGDGGSAILTFTSPITNGVGYDFAVFENSFNDVFLELAFVEVSSDGINYFRFPSTSNTQTLTQIGPFDNTGDATKINNLAGKYRANYGTPFDLQELYGTNGLDLNNITHVKVIDVVGNINAPYATYDFTGNPINDPYPTQFASCGFDLDAIGVINQSVVGLTKEELIAASIVVYPNPATEEINVLSNRFQINTIVLLDINGRIIEKTMEPKINIKELEIGLYYLRINNSDGSSIVKKFIKNQ
jgi:hypothetical protein